MKKGNTVLIMYSLKQPEIAKVIDKYYMNKYKHLKQK